MTSSRKPELHNVSQHRQRGIEPRPISTSTENLVKFGRIVSDKQTTRYTYRNIRIPPGSEVSILIQPKLNILFIGVSASF